MRMRMLIVLLVFRHLIALNCSIQSILDCFWICLIAIDLLFRWESYSKRKKQREDLIVLIRAIYRCVNYLVFDNFDHFSAHPMPELLLNIEERKIDRNWNCELNILQIGHYGWNLQKSVLIEIFSFFFFSHLDQCIHFTITSALWYVCMLLFSITSSFSFLFHSEFN